MALSVKRVTSVLSFGLAAISNFVAAEQVQHPLRLMLNSDVLQTLFNKGDQRMLEAFSDLRVTLEDKSETCPDFKSAAFSVTTAEGVDISTYDFDVSLNDDDKGFLGFEGKNLRVKGTATFNNDKTVEFEVPVEKCKFEAQFISEDNKEILAINKNARKPTVKDFEFELGRIVFDDASVAEGC